MDKSWVIVITGDEMQTLSGKTFPMEVYPGCDHFFKLACFVKENNICYPYNEFYFSSDIVKLAALGNVTLLLGVNCHIVALPPYLTQYQFEELGKSKDLFFNEKSLVSIMNIVENDGKLIYEPISTNDSFKRYDNLVAEKFQKGLCKKISK